MMQSHNNIRRSLEQGRKLSFFLGLVGLWMLLNPVNAQSLDSIISEAVAFESEGVNLAGTRYQPTNPLAGLVIVHGSDQVPRMTDFALLLAQKVITVLTYDKRGVGKSGGVYAGPEVGTNNIDSTNLTLLAKDASAAVNQLHAFNKKHTDWPHWVQSSRLDHPNCS